MVGFPFQVLGVFSLHSSWRWISIFLGPEILFETGKVRSLSCNGFGVGRYYLESYFKIIHRFPFSFRYNNERVVCPKK